MKKTKKKVLLPYHFDFCSKLGLQSKLSEPPNGGNYGQNCFADPGKIHSHKDKKIAEKEENPSKHSNSGPPLVVDEGINITLRKAVKVLLTPRIIQIS